MTNGEELKRIDEKSYTKEKSKLDWSHCEKELSTKVNN